MVIERLRARVSALERDQCIAAVLLGGILLLVVELRFEHREALGETWRSWIPLVYGGTTVLVGSFALLRWQAGGRRWLAALFGAGLLVGLAGFWFHTDGHPLRAVIDALAAFSIPLGQDGGVKPGSKPPSLAPLAFCGQGLLGLLACGRIRAARPPRASSALSSSSSI
jgi:hypothetical protein